jgi:hypothetical protein
MDTAKTTHLMIRMSEADKAKLVAGAARLTIKTRKRVSVAQLLRDAALEKIARLDKTSETEVAS